MKSSSLAPNQQHQQQQSNTNSNTNNQQSLKQTLIQRYTTSSSSSLTSSSLHNNDTFFGKSSIAQSSRQDEPFDPFGNGTVLPQSTTSKKSKAIQKQQQNQQNQYQHQQPNVAAAAQQQQQTMDAHVDSTFEFEFDFSDVIGDTSSTTSTTTTSTSSTAMNTARSNNNNNNNKTQSKKPQLQTDVRYSDRPPAQFQFPSIQLDSPPETDEDALDTYIYPDNMTVRDYQYNIVSNAFYRNTMVCLPTGLGKTFIASVVMMNFYRWFPRSKIVFMVHSRPLVSQQYEAFHQITGIPLSDTVEFTGSVKAQLRVTGWTKKRIFFLTPQILAKDIEAGRCDPSNISLVVVDEAHKAKGEYSYCTSVQMIAKATRYFRILALTASPGSTKQSIQTVIDNLLISKMDIRTEKSLDISPYVHQKQIEVIVVPITAQIQPLLDLLNRVKQIPYNNLNKSGACRKPLDQISMGFAIQMREIMMKKQEKNFGLFNNFTALINLCRASNTLIKHGLDYFYDIIKGFGAKKTKPVVEILGSRDWNDMMTLATSMTGKVTHGKLNKLCEVITDHFTNSTETSTRVMVFVENRATVQEIINHIGKTTSSMIKVMPFIGQAQGKNSKGLNQTEQASILNRFRSGAYNTLVATCIGEEGLDFGEVDLIICYDTQQSTVRNIQRMGRTGRKRKGRCVVLLSAGVEEDIYHNSKSKLDSITKDMNVFVFHRSERMLPDGLWPRAEYRKVDSVERHAATAMGHDGKVKRVKKRSAFLTNEEIRYLDNNYKDASTINVPLDLQRWSHLNNIATPTHQVDHSVCTNIMVSIYESIERNKQSELDSIMSQYYKNVGDGVGMGMGNGMDIDKDNSSAPAFNDYNPSVPSPEIDRHDRLHQEPIRVDIDIDNQEHHDQQAPPNDNTIDFDFDDFGGDVPSPPTPQPTKASTSSSPIRLFLPPDLGDIEVPVILDPIVIRTPPSFRPPAKSSTMPPTTVAFSHSDTSTPAKPMSNVDKSSPVHVSPNKPSTSSSSASVVVANDVRVVVSTNTNPNPSNSSSNDEIIARSPPQHSSSPLNISFTTPQKPDKDRNTSRLLKKCAISPIKRKKVQQQPQQLPKRKLDDSLLEESSGVTDENSSPVQKRTKRPRIKDRVLNLFELEADDEDEDDSLDSGDENMDDYDVNDSFICDDTPEDSMDTSQDSQATQAAKKKKQEKKKMSMQSIYMRSLLSQNEFDGRGRTNLGGFIFKPSTNPSKNKTPILRPPPSLLPHIDSEEEEDVGDDAGDGQPAVASDEVDDDDVVANTQEELDSSVITSSQQQQNNKVPTAVAPVTSLPLQLGDLNNNNNSTNTNSDVRPDSEMPELKRFGSSTFNKEFNVNVWNGDKDQDGYWSDSD
ncbi:hypothetical protein SAMD00019534_097000 [Acytostelium subglobosum LB1]|uniref:hypothetical protein n=1 Tax=Acytostelium subglobosum LB1 TaxID=1410327 RepID=UPI0006450E00|nr:hypothetical protein SAMD00019534_097000 [Acytostelium subglobosum LB1]GAM26525.1 hypothetical protein SAMD00019534_097000 [Acytostelium subglobosum LB1]|eukprot:XP_012750621.1 hypothetical protein SAMD00019534_097000 [Acytostelium subglobosum LB1]